MQVRPHSQPIQSVPFGRTLPPRKPVEPVAAESGPVARAGELPRFGKYARPLLHPVQPKFGGRVDHAINLNRLDREDNAIIAEQRRLHPDLVEANEIRKKAVEAVKNAGLTPNDVEFYVVPDMIFLMMAARNGFLERYPHWSWGQDLFTKFIKPRLEGRRPFTEVVQPNSPANAFLPDYEPTYAKKARMFFALARSDFYRNNIYFRKVNPRLREELTDHVVKFRRIQDNLAATLTEKAGKIPDEQLSVETGISADRIARFLQGRITASDVGMETVEEFVDKVHSVRELVDIARGPRKIQDKPTWENPEYDILGFLVKHSKVLNSWQRDVVEILRRQTYALLPLEKTQLISGGWAYFWNDKLNAMNPKMWDFKNMSREVRWTSRVFQQDPVKVNQYQLGFEMFRHLEKDLKKKYADDPNQDQKVRDELFKVRKEHYDVSFLREYLTKETVEALLMYNYDPKKQGTNSQKTGTKLYISTHDYEAIKARLIEMYQNAGQPMIGVVNADYGGEGELVLNHIYAYDLKDDYARKTLRNLALLWGNKVYLETRKTDDNGEQKEIVLWSDGKTFGDRTAALSREEDEEASEGGEV